jgi:alpha-glucoside transport system substrate-binding protein
MIKKAIAYAAAMGVLCSGASAEGLLFSPGDDLRFNWASFDGFALRHNLSGQELSVFGPWRGEDKILFESVLAYFTAATGAVVDYASSEHYESQIVIDTSSGSPADITILPQPGLIADLAAKGFLAPLGNKTEDWLAQNYAAPDSWINLGTYKGKDGTPALYAFPYKAELKSLVWYVPENFADAGYHVPQSMEALQKLTDQIAADGGTPWCIGLGSGGATGWPATDWVEDFLLRQQSPEVYDQWVTNKIAFDDPRILAAIDGFGDFARNDSYVDGGAAAVAVTDFRDSAKGLFRSPPKCYLHRQASFIPSYFPEGTELGRDVDFFYFPAYADKDLGQPVLGSGTLAMITRDTPAARAFIEFLQTPIAHEIWMAQSSFLTPLKSVNPEAYANDTMRKQGKILANATLFRFDGSDLMPGKIGAGVFWEAMVDYAGGASAAEVAGSVQAAWDALK